MNAYQDKLQASLLGKPKSKHWLFAYYAFATNHHSLAQARSGAIRTLIGQWHDCPGLSSPTWKLWEFVQNLRRELKKSGRVVIWGEEWSWTEEQFIPQAKSLKTKKSKRKMFRF